MHLVSFIYTNLAVSPGNDTILLIYTSRDLANNFKWYFVTRAIRAPFASSFSVVALYTRFLDL
jgi:hypothetical protein